MHDLSSFESAVRALGDALRSRGWRVATAESCTGGLLAAACTAVAGSSDWFDRGFVTYSNAAKTRQLGVPAALIATHGAVSAEVARAMALGAVDQSDADLAVSITGIAGPGGAVPGKPVGTVWLAVALRSDASVETTPLHLRGNRAAVRDAAVDAALAALQTAAASRSRRRQ